MSQVIVTKTRPTVKPTFIVPPAFDLQVWAEVHSTDSEESPFTQSTTFPAPRGTYKHPGSAPQGLPHQAMSLNQRINLLRGPEENGID